MVVINYSWTYDTFSDLVWAQQQIEKYTNYLGARRYFQKEILSYKFWFNDSGFNANFQFKDMNSYKDYTNAANGRTLESKLNEKASGSNKYLIGTGSLLSQIGFKTTDTWEGLAETDLYGKNFFGIVGGGIPEEIMDQYSTDKPDPSQPVPSNDPPQEIIDEVDSFELDAEDPEDDGWIYDNTETYVVYAFVDKSCIGKKLKNWTAIFIVDIVASSINLSTLDTVNDDLW